MTKATVSFLPLFLLPLLACDTSLENSVPTVPVTEFRSLGDLEVVAQFNPQYGETPESVAVDPAGNKYISMALTGEIRKIDPQGAQSSLTYLPLGQCAPNPFPPIMGALALDFFGNLYVGAATCDPNDRGIYRVEPDGDTTKIASLPVDALPNGIAVRLGRVYVADSGAPRIWRAPTTGDGSLAEVWLEDPLLADPNPFDLAPGANGLQFFLGDMYVANAGASTIVQIPLEPGGQYDGDLQPGVSFNKYGPVGSGAEIEVDFPGCDDFGFDVLGRLYCTTDPFQSVIRLDPQQGTAEVILTAADGLDGPTAAAFGRRGDGHSLYITNASFPFFPSTGHGPSLLRLEVGLPGYPLR